MSKAVLSIFVAVTAVKVNSRWKRCYLNSWQMVNNSISKTSIRTCHQ